MTFKYIHLIQKLLFLDKKYSLFTNYIKYIQFHIIFNTGYS